MLGYESNGVAYLVCRHCSLGQKNDIFAGSNKTFRSTLSLVSMRFTAKDGASMDTRRSGK